MKWLWILGLTVSLLTTLASAQMREWAGARGSKLKAEFVELKFNTVVFKNEEGKLVEIPIAKLSPADQVLARQLSMNRARGALPGRASQPSATPTNVLPHFIDGKWAGWHAVYEHPKLDVLVETNGYIRIQPKDNGKPVGSAIPCSWGIGYYPAPGELPKGRAVLYFDEPPAPSIIKDKYRYKGVVEDKVKFEVEIEFADNTVEFKVEMREPSGIIAGYLAVGVRIHGTHSFPDGTPREKIIKALQGYSLRYKEPKENEVQLEYYPHITLTNSVVSGTVKGPWGPRVVTVEQKRGAVYLSNYTLTPLYAGFTFSKYLGQGPTGPGILFTVE